MSSRFPLSEVDDLIRLLSRARELWPDKVAWIFEASGRRLTFTQIDEQSSQLALALSRWRIRSGDRVAVMVRNEPEFPLLWLALAKLSAVLVPINVNYRELDSQHVLTNSDAKMVICADEFLPLMKKLASKHISHIRVVTPSEVATTFRSTNSSGLFWTEAEKPVNIQYTSGTTGAPKGCILPHRYWTTLAKSLVEAHPSLSEDDIMFTAQPFHYIDPQWNVAAGLASGASLVIADRFHPKTFWDTVRKNQVTWFYCLGLMPALLLGTEPSPADRNHRVRAISASDIPRDLHEALEKRWGVPWFEAFGMTETGSDIRMSVSDHDETVGTGCIGKPTHYREAIIADETNLPLTHGQTGELLIRGIGLMRGYHKDPEATTKVFAGGWFHTGDLAKMDEAGRIFYVGRIKDMIRRSGENISAEEVEHALETHPAIESAAVLGVEDSLRGQEAHACIVLKSASNGATENMADSNAYPTPKELADFCAEKIAYFKIPRYWSYLDEMPLTPSERIAKGVLRESIRTTLKSYDLAEARWRGTRKNLPEEQY